MPILQGACTAGKAAFAAGTIVPASDVIKIALYTSLANLSYLTTVYTTTEEIVGTGYTAGGLTLTGATVGSSDRTAWLTFNNPTWLNTTFTTRGALIYDSSKGNVAIAVLDFGSDKSTINAPFTVTLPVASAITALIRFN